MKFISLLTMFALTTVLANTLIASPLETLDQRLSYVVGSNIASQLKRDDVKFDFDAFRLAVDEVMKDKPHSLSDDDKRNAVKELQKRVAQKKTAELSAHNAKAGKAYLAANAEKEGVVVTKSGLQYKEIIRGEGEVPSAKSRVKVHYKGTLIDGTEFDNSYKRGTPATFPVTGVIKGWIEALQLMNVGDKFELAIPSELAYGKRGSGSKIAPDTTLLFELELLEILK